MATYNLVEVMDRIMDIINDGVFFAEICEIPGDDTSSTCLSFSVPDPDDESWEHSLKYIRALESA